MCKANFGNEDIKTDSYSVYRHYHRDGKWYELMDYCLNDVRLTQQLFQLIFSEKRLNYYDLHILKQVELDQPQAGKIEFVEAAESFF